MTAIVVSHIGPHPRNAASRHDQRHALGNVTLRRPASSCNSATVVPRTLSSVSNWGRPPAQLHHSPSDVVASAPVCVQLADVEPAGHEFASNVIAANARSPFAWQLGSSRAFCTAVVTPTPAATAPATALAVAAVPDAPEPPCDTLAARETSAAVATLVCVTVVVAT